MEAPFRDPRFDVPALVMGALGTAALSVGLAALFLHESRAHTVDSGATSGSLADGFSAFAGAALGMLIGCAIAACVCRRGSRLATGILAGFLGWLIGLVPTIIATRPTDESVKAALGDAFVLGAFLTLVVLTGAAVGAGIGVMLDKSSLRGSP